MDKLAHKALSAGQVAVSLHPHAAFRLPASLGNARFHLLVQLRIALLEEGIQLRLA